MIAPVFSLLAASGAVTAIVGSSPVRVFPAGNIPQSTTTDPNSNLPCVSWQTIAGATENMLADRPVVDNQRIQIDCWALTFGQANTLGDAVMAALELNGYCVSINGHDYDSDTKRYRTSFDFSFWTQH